MKESKLEYFDFKIPVTTSFEDVFSHFYYAENTSSDVISKTLLPTFQTILIFTFDTKSILHSKHKTKIEIDKCLVLGPIKKAFNYSLLPYSKILVANFKDDAFYRFFGNATFAEHLPINPDELFDINCFTDLWTELNDMNDINCQVNCILEFCKPYIKQRNIIAEKLANFNDETLNPIKTVASQQNQTERNIQLNHKKTLGFTSKEISRYQRFLKAIEHIQHLATTATKIDWFEIINKCGYYDQSQLIHDFKYYLNLSPTKYLKFQKNICISKMK